MRKKIFSIFGIVAVVAFFLPWLKSCDKVESGYQLLIVGSLKDFTVGSITSLNTGLLFLLIPLFVIACAWIGWRRKWLEKAFIVLSVMSLVNIGVWGGMAANSGISEWGTEFHVHAIKMFRCLGVFVISAVFLAVLLMKWHKRRYLNMGWGQTALVFHLFGPLGIGMTFEPRYYGIWTYLFATAMLCVGAVWDWIAESRSRPPE